MIGDKSPCLEVRGLTKTFPGVIANDDVSFQVQPGEIHALFGENGAGKSTLVKMIYGVLQPSAGEILWDGQVTHIPSPKAARQMGVGMVFQHFSLFEAMTVLENIAIGMDASISHSKLEARICDVMNKYGLTLDPNRYVHSLSVGERQRIEIVRTLLLNPQLLIMDEPTSVLTPQEVRHLFGTLRQLASDGCSILYISHKLNEIQELCDEATILRGGKLVGTCNPKKETAKSMAKMMIGGDLKKIKHSEHREIGETRFEVCGLNVLGDGDFGVSLSDVSFAVQAGEIFGIVGVAGNGQNELFLALSGESLANSNDVICLDGLGVGQMGSDKRRVRGLCAVPEERNGHAAIPDFSLSDNTVLTTRESQNLIRSGLVNKKTAIRYTDNVIKTFSVKATGTEALAGSLSGGNLQKYIMGREILQKPSVLVVSQPTWGVDAGAAATIHQALVDLASEGSAIIIISQDLDELLAICDEVAVLNEGNLSETLKVGEASIDEIGLLMGGMHADNSEGTLNVA